MVLFPPAVLHSEGPLKKNQYKISCQAAAIYLGWPQKWVVWKQDRELKVRLAVHLFPVGSVEGAFCYFLFCWSNTQKQGVGGLPWLCLWRNSYAVTWCNCRKLNWVWGMIIIPLCHQQSKTTPRSGFCFNLSTTFKNAYINTGLLLH